MIVTDLSVLRQISTETNVDVCRQCNIFERLEKELAESETPGVGLSAIQIGVPIQACIIRHKYKSGFNEERWLKLNMINPIIEESLNLQRCNGERCLSLPGVIVDTERHQQVTATWVDYNENKIMKAVFTDFEAQVLQHEADHLSGILITDRRFKVMEKVGRNDLCPCGSGLKFKRCCLK